MQLTPKTHKGKNKIHEAGTDQWFLISEPQSVTFAKGIWAHIAPGSHPEAAKHSRWVRWDEPDKDFSFPRSLPSNSRL